MNEFSQGDKVKLTKKREATTILGQGSLPGGLFVSEAGAEVFIPEGRIMQVSEELDLGLGDMDASPMPRISADLVNREAFNKRFLKVE